MLTSNNMPDGRENGGGDRGGDERAGRGGDVCDVEQKCLWRPDPAVRTNMDEFRDLVNDKHDLHLGSYEDLYNWSVCNYVDFWREFWNFSGVKYSEDYSEVVDPTAKISDIPTWFSGSKLNYAENLLEGGDGDKVALYETGEAIEGYKTVTFSALRQRVSSLAAALRGVGVVAGDRVVGYLPNTSTAVEACLAAASIGAVWSSTSPDFGAKAVLDRFAQIEPKVLFSVTNVTYNGKRHDHLAKLRQVASGLAGTVVKVVVVDDEAVERAAIDDIDNSCWLSEFTACHVCVRAEYAQVSFCHPLYIMYSSGTTGLPKCMVHSVGGTLIQHLKEHVLHSNMKQSDIIIYYTTTGWMMWNWQISALAIGASVVLYDGSPLKPHDAALFDLVDNIGITILGTSAKWLSVLEERGVCPQSSHSLSTLHTILSTGSPLKPTSYTYVYDKVKPTVMLSSISGGTDIMGCFLGANPTVPVYEGEVQARNLAMAVESWDHNGRSVEGEAGDLVCMKPFPSQPVYFWNDADGLKYHKAYFSRFSDVWCHGDYCIINPVTKGITMLGRSDGVLNPSGVRFGSAEIYNIVEEIEEVGDSVCVGQCHPTSGDERVVLFVKLKPGLSWSETLADKIKHRVRQCLSARHVPAIIAPVRDIPYTVSGKKVEVAVKRLISGGQVDNMGALSNPTCMEEYRNMTVLDVW